MLRILIVDDHEVVRLGLRTLLSRNPDFAVVGEAGSAQEALEKTRLYRPDVVVLDVRLPGKNGIQACAMIKEEMPETNVIILTSYAEDKRARHCWIRS
jgi:DNA-binding NarL/FixJ family response regulator